MLHDFSYILCCKGVNEYVVVSLALIYIPWMTNDIEHLVLCLVARSLSFFVSVFREGLFSAELQAVFLFNGVR